MRLNFGKRQLAIAGTVAVAGLAVGCGSSDDKDKAPAGANASAETTTAASFTGEPIVIATTTSINSPVVNYPQVFSGVNAAVRAINEKGGIGGRKVVVVTCDGKGDPNQEVACARKAISEKAVAAVGPFTRANPGGWTQTLEKAGIPVIAEAQTVAEQYKAANTYPIDFPLGAMSICVSSALVDKLGAKKVAGAASESPNGKAGGLLIDAAAKHEGIPFTGMTYAPLTQTDFGSTVQKFSSAGVDLIATIVAPQGQGAMAAAATAVGKKWSSCTIDTQGTGELLAKFGPAAANYYVAANLPPLSAASEHPMLDEFKAQMKAEEDAGDKAASTDIETYSPIGLRAWLGMQVFEQVAAKMDGPIDAKTFGAAIAQAKVDLGGIVPDLDFAKPVGDAALPRVFNDYVGLMKWDAGDKTFTVVPGISMNTIPVISGS